MRTPIATSAVVALTLTVLAPAALAQAQQEQTSKNRFCLETGKNGEARCAFQSLAQCERAKPRGSAQRCFDRTTMMAATPPGETTGAGDRSPSPRHGTRERSQR